jgi:hypothetical protein
MASGEESPFATRGPKPWMPVVSDRDDLRKRQRQ